MLTQSIDDKIFEFAVGCALADAVQMQAYPYGKKPKVTDCSKAVEYIKALAEKVLNGKFYPHSSDSQDSFNEEFFKTVELVKSIPNFTFGNAQKLINMTFKHMYIYTYNNAACKRKFDVCHCPLDSVMLNTVWKLIKEKGRNDLLGSFVKAGDFKTSWSKEDFSTQNEYKASRYMTFQRAVRSLADEMSLSPIEFDYFIWQ